MWQEVPYCNGAGQELVQILIALCSNILNTMTVVIFGGPWWFDHIWWKLESMKRVHKLVERCESVYKSTFLQGAPSQRRCDL